jgi:hypothetical protein
VYYLIALGLIVAGMIVVFLYVAKRALSPTEIDPDPRSRVPIMRCRHCHTVVTKRDAGQHGVNCPQRPGASG